jgi:predicted transcriptional regulator
MQKEKIKRILDTFPDDVDMDALREKIFLLDKIEQGEKEIAEGKGVAHEEVKKRLQTWLK